MTPVLQGNLEFSEFYRVFDPPDLPSFNSLSLFSLTHFLLVFLWPLRLSSINICYMCTSFSAKLSKFYSMPVFSLTHPTLWAFSPTASTLICKLLIFGFFTCLFYMSNIYYVPGTVLGAKDSPGYNGSRIPCLYIWRLNISRQDTKKLASGGERIVKELRQI